MVSKVSCCWTYYVHKFKLASGNTLITLLISLVDCLNFSWYLPTYRISLFIHLSVISYFVVLACIMQIHAGVGGIISPIYPSFSPKFSALYWKQPNSKVLDIFGPKNRPNLKKKNQFWFQGAIISTYILHLAQNLHHCIENNRRMNDDGLNSKILYIFGPLKKS